MKGLLFRTVLVSAAVPLPAVAETGQSPKPHIYVHRANAGGEWAISFGWVDLVADVAVTSAQESTIRASVHEVLFGPWFMSPGDTLEFVNDVDVHGAPSFVPGERALVFLHYVERNRHWYLFPTPGYKLTPVESQEGGPSAAPEYKYLDVGERRLSNDHLRRAVDRELRPRELGRVLEQAEAVVVGSVTGATKYVQAASGGWEPTTEIRGHEEIVHHPARSFQQIEFAVGEVLKGDAGVNIKLHLPTMDSSEFYELTANGPEVLVDNLPSRVPSLAPGDRYLAFLRRRGDEWELATDGLSSLFRVLDGEIVSKFGYPLAQVRTEVQAK
jgi:hypothetical protein